MGGDDTMGGGMDDYGPDGAGAQTGVPVWACAVIVVLAVGVVAAVVVVLVVLQENKRRNDRAAQLMEE